MESPRSHRAMISIFELSSARSVIVFPMRPAAPTSNTRRADVFIVTEPSPYPLPLQGRGGAHCSYEIRIVRNLCTFRSASPSEERGLNGFTYFVRTLRG